MKIEVEKMKITNFDREQVSEWKGGDPLPPNAPPSAGKAQWSRGRAGAEGVKGVVNNFRDFVLKSGFLDLLYLPIIVWERNTPFYPLHPLPPGHLTRKSRLLTRQHTHTATGHVIGTTCHRQIERNCR